MKISKLKFLKSLLYIGIFFIYLNNNLLLSQNIFLVPSNKIISKIKYFAKNSFENNRYVNQYYDSTSLSININKIGKSEVEVMDLKNNNDWYEYIRLYRAIESKYTMGDLVEISTISPEKIFSLSHSGKLMILRDTIKFINNFLSEIPQQDRKYENILKYLISSIEGLDIVKIFLTSKEIKDADEIMIFEYKGKLTLGTFMITIKDYQVLDFNIQFKK